jgi:hypothetical protein
LTSHWLLYETDLLELSGALRIVLADPAAVRQRWLAGESVFASARCMTAAEAIAVQI